ncbi:hypothetical protein [Reichenbachiella sp. MALMAid0571]|uniref:hypothetical protein n=1 Tax=Reichenbachiella sp. MALMAid0571 TaxID=3143939 RepID=UPI0032DE507F
MGTSKTDVFVYAHWVGMPDPKLIGLLSAHQGKDFILKGFDVMSSWKCSTLALVSSNLRDKGIYSTKNFI